MKAEQIIRQLQLSLPLFTDLVNDFVVPDSVVVSSEIATVTLPAHGLLSNQKGFMKNGVVPNELTSLTSVGKIATAVTVNRHDLTDGFTQTVPIFGANQPEFNGTFEFIKVIDRNTFEYRLVDMPSTSPATGSPTLGEFRLNEGVNGLKTITVIDADIFTYPAENTPDVTVTGDLKFAPITNPNNVLVGARIGGALTIQRAIASYTEQPPDKAWLFAVLEDDEFNRDRKVTSDSIAQSAAGTVIRQRIISPFTIYAFISTKNSLSGMREGDIMRDFAPALYRSLIGVEFDSGLSQEVWASVTGVGHGFFDYGGAYYIHEFKFQTQNDLTVGDTTRANNLNRAFTQVGISISSEDANPDTVKLTVNAQLN